MTNRIGQRFGNYQVKRFLGRGGFAEVYLGEHIHLNAQVAIKFLQSQIASQFQESFLNEAKTIAMLKHPNILRVLDFGFEETTPFLVMDYAPMGTLRDHYPHGTRVPLPMVLSYAQQIGSALQYAHDSHIIHRDIKPENMLLENEYKVLLSDFGIATTVHSTSSTQTGTLLGSLHYMAPERIQGKSYAASDQYALGVTIYEWLCGVRPFTGESFPEVAMQHLIQPPPPLCARVPSIPFQVEQVILISLAKDPSQRFATVSAFVEALTQASQSLSGLASQDSTTIRQPNRVPPFLVQTQPAQTTPQMNAAPHDFPSASFTDAQQKQEKAYQTLLKKIRPKYDSYSALIVQTPPEQIGAVVQIEEEEHWHQYGESLSPSTSRVKRRDVDGVSFAVAIFTDLLAEDCFVWITEDNLISISLREGTTALIQIPPSTTAKQEMRLPNGRTIAFTPVEPLYS